MEIELDAHVKDISDKKKKENVQKSVWTVWMLLVSEAKYNE